MAIVKTRLTALIAVLVTSSACFAENSGLTVPGNGSYTLNGTVFISRFVMPAVSVTIMDGIHAGQSRTTDGAGNYSFVDLAPSAFTLQANTAAGYEAYGYGTQNKAVNLTANQTVNFLFTDH